MKHANKLWLILAVIALIGFVVIACDNGNGNGACTTHTVGADATCTTDQTCTKCGIVIVGKLNHNFADNWLPTGTSDWHNDEEDECKQAIETLNCTRTNCNVTNGTRISDPCKGTQALVIVDGVVMDDPANKALAVVCIPDYRDGEPVTEIAPSAFQSDVSPFENTTLTSIRIGANIETIGSIAFSYCINLVNITIPEKVKTIGEQAFYFNNSLENVTFTDNSQLQTIGGSAFTRCISLTSIEIPASVTSIVSYAFEDCFALEIISIKAELPPNLGTGAFTVDEGSAMLPNLTAIFVPAGSVEAYKQATNWSVYASRIQAIE